MSDAEFLSECAAIVGDSHLLCQDIDTAPYLTDWRRRYTGRALAVVLPTDTAQTAAVVRACNRHGVAIVPQGGNTGLVGGATPCEPGRQIVLSLRRLNRIRDIDLDNHTLTAEAGCILQHVQNAAHDAGRLFPLSLAAEGSCTLGGNLATNAGGTAVLRYGNARELCLGLEVVTAQGEVWDGLRGLRKDNTGYDLRDLFIGSEGTLGVITAAVLKLHPLPAAQVAALVAVPSANAALELLQSAQDRLGAALTAFELMSDACLALVEKHVPSSRLPLAERAPWYVLIEISDARSESQAQGAMEEFLETAFDAGRVSDAALSGSLAQFHALWALRENISEAQGADGPTIKHDISLPISAIPDFLESASSEITRKWPQARLVVFGHMGDGNLHYNLSPSEHYADAAHVADFLDIEPSINRFVHDSVASRGGSISAEHGLGVLRRDEAARYKSPVEMQLMHAIKAALDPHGLMNPGKQLKPNTAKTSWNSCNE